MDGIASRMCAAVGLALVGVLCAAAPALATDGKVTGTKWHDLDADGVKEAGEPVLKDWLIYLDTNRDGDHDSGEPAAKTDASGNYAITGIRWWWDKHKPKTYDVREKPVAQQPQDLDRCSYPADCEHTLTFSYTSHIYAGKNFGNYKSGKIVVKKVNVGGTQTDTFSFTSAKLGNFSMAAGQKQFASLAPGSYSVAEQPAAGYTLVSATCDDGSTPAEIKLSSGETVTCTFTNTRKATLTLKKTEGGASDLSREWRFVLRGGPDGVEIARSTAGGATVGFGHLLPGAYTLCEVDLPDGWISSLGPAVDGAACVELTLAPGEAEQLAIDNIRPQIELLKQVRRAGDAGWAKQATMQVGQKAEYLLTVTNPGVGPMVDLVVVDGRCDAAPVYAAGDTDADGELDESEAWTYRCNHVVIAADGARFVNTATADAADKRGNPVRDSDTATVTVTKPEPPKQPEPPRTPPGTPSTPPAAAPPAQQQTLPAKIVSGTARLRGPSGCTRRPFKAKVTGRRIARVTFWLDGKRVERVVAKQGRRAFALKVDPRRVARGVHRVTARVVFAASSETAPRTLRLSFQRCARQVTTPQFTG